jgi:hypothetical protein
MKRPAQFSVQKSVVSYMCLGEYKAPSNLDRVHGSSMSDFDADPQPRKVAVVRDLLLSIKPGYQRRSLAGNILRAKSGMSWQMSI